MIDLLLARQASIAVVLFIIFQASVRFDQLGLFSYRVVIASRIIELIITMGLVMFLFLQRLIIHGLFFLLKFPSLLSKGRVVSIVGLPLRTKLGPVLASFFLSAYNFNIALQASPFIFTQHGLIRRLLINSNLVIILIFVRKGKLSRHKLREQLE